MSILSKDDKKNLLISIIGLPIYFFFRNKRIQIDPTERRLRALESHVTEQDNRINSLYSWGGRHNHNKETGECIFTPGDVYEHHYGDERKSEEVK